MPTWKRGTIDWVSCSDGKHRLETLAYCPDMGKIDRFETRGIPKDPFIKVYCQGVCYIYGDDRQCRLARMRSYITLGACERESDPEGLKRARKERAVALGRSLDKELAGGCVTDPRVLRAYILMWYEVCNNGTVDKINKLFDQSVHMSVSEAGEWMIRNHFNYAPEYFGTIFIQDDEYAAYRLNARFLEDPYWLPTKQS